MDENAKHREWVVKTLTSHSEKLKTIFNLNMAVRDQILEQNGRVRELEKQLERHKGAGIFLTCLFSAMMVLITMFSKNY